MRQITLVLACVMCMLAPIFGVAQTEYQIPESMPANNGELEWYVYKDKIGEVKVDKKDVEVKSKLGAGNLVAFTYAKAPIDFKGDFYLSATMKPEKVDDKHLFGFAFNVASENDYNAVLFDKQFCYYVRVTNGVIIQGLRDRTLYKRAKTKGDKWIIALERKNLGEFSLTLNGLEIRTFPATTQFTFPAIGVCAVNKNKVVLSEVAYEQWAVPADEE